MKKKILLPLLLLFVSNSLMNAQTIWGTGSGNPTTEAIGEFANAFGTANAWTAVDITPNAFWTRTTTGLTQGAYATGSLPINSPSMNNGVALFDSDYLDNGGVQGAFGQGTCPSPHRGELHSPIIDLTGYTNSSLNAKMYLNYRNFQITEISIGFSSDGGNSWTDFSISQGVVTNQTFNSAYITVPLVNVTNGISNLTSCKLRLNFDGDYYFIMVDDLSLELACTPPVSPTNTTVNSAVCFGNTAVLSATGLGTIGWYADANATTYLSGGTSFTTGVLTSDTTFYVQDSTCSASSLTAVTITMNQNTSSSQTVTLCPNESLTVGSSVYTSAGTYTDILSNALGCDSTVTSNVTLSTVDISTTESGMTSSANANGATYQWVDCGNNFSILNGETGQSFTATTDGSYAVIVTSANCSDTSVCVLLSTNGLAVNTVFDWSISPNPTQSIVKVTTSEEIISLALISLNGTLLKTSNTSEISLEDYPTGMYLLQIQTTKGTGTSRIIRE